MADLRDRATSRGGEDEDIPEPAPVRRLRLLVSTLMVVLIAGMITVAAALVIRLGIGPGTEPRAPLAPVSAEALTLPEGAEIRALGRGPGEVLVVTRDADGAERLRVLDAATGAERSVTPIRRE
jgi:hypothetical protein